MLDWVRKEKTYYIKRSGEAYQLLIPEENPMDVGHWKPVLSDEIFLNFYDILLEDYFLDIDKDDRILYDTSITQRERDHIDQAFNLCKAMNKAKSTLATALEASERVRGMPVSPVMELRQMIEYALEELSD